MRGASGSAGTDVPGFVLAGSPSISAGCTCAALTWSSTRSSCRRLRCGGRRACRDPADRVPYGRSSSAGAIPVRCCCPLWQPDRAAAYRADGLEQQVPPTGHAGQDRRHCRWHLRRPARVRHRRRLSDRRATGPARVRSSRPSLPRGRPMHRPGVPPPRSRRVRCSPADSGRHRQVVAAGGRQHPRALELQATDQDLVGPYHREGRRPGKAETVPGRVLGRVHL